MSTKRYGRKKTVTDQFFNVYHRVPDSVKKFTDPLVKTGIRAERVNRPYREEGIAKGQLWINRHIVTRINDGRTKVDRVVGTAQKFTNKLTNKKKK